MARKINAIPGILAEAAEVPEKPAQRPRTPNVVRTPVKPAPAPTPPAKDESERLTVRSALDLPPEQHTALQHYAVDAGAELGWPVRPQFVVRAVVEQLLNDDVLQAAILDHVRAQGRPTRRRSS